MQAITIAEKGRSDARVYFMSMTCLGLSAFGNRCSCVSIGNTRGFPVPAHRIGEARCLVPRRPPASAVDRSASPAARWSIQRALCSVRVFVNSEIRD